MSMPLEPTATAASRRASPSPESLARALTRPTAAPVELRDTLTSWILLTEDRAYRLFKRVRLPSVDLTTMEGCLRACEAEVGADRALGGDTVLGVRAVLRVGDSFALAAPGRSDALDFVVEMRRYDEASPLASTADGRELPEAVAELVGARLARLHADAPATPAVDVLAASKTRWHHAAGALRGAGGAALPPRRLAALERFADAFIRARGAQLRERAGRGLVRDAHGDLRAAHVLVKDGGMTLVGRELFDSSARHADVGQDLATLTTDLELHGAASAAEVLVRAYRVAGGDPGDEQLRAFWGAQRALVDATQMLQRAAQVRADPEVYAATLERARSLAELAERLSWRARGPVALLVGGRPRDGRARLAAALAVRSGWPLLHGDDAEALVAGAAGGCVVIEHPLSDIDGERALLHALRRTGRQTRVVECRAAEGLHAAIAADVPGRHRVVVDPDGDAEDLIDHVASMLDGALRDLAPRAGA